METLKRWPKPWLRAPKAAATLKFNSAITWIADDLALFDALAVGAPTYNHAMPVDFKNLFEEAGAKGLNLKGKLGVAFGSYGWSGEAPKLVLEILKNRFEMQIIEPPLLAKYTPDAECVGCMQ